MTSLILLLRIIVSLVMMIIIMYNNEITIQQQMNLHGKLVIRNKSEIIFNTEMKTSLKHGNSDHTCGVCTV